MIITFVCSIVVSGLSCDEVSSYPEFERGLFNSTLIANGFEDFESSSDILYIFDIPQTHSTNSCSSMEVTVQTCYTSSMHPEKHSNIYIKIVEFDQERNTYDVSLVETYRTVGNNINQSCIEVVAENNTYACCQTFILDSRFLELDAFSRLGVAYGGSVVKPLYLANESRMVETYTFIYYGNVHAPINRINGSNEPTPLFHIIVSSGKTM